MSNQIQNELIIEPGKSISNYWRELWGYRELFLFLSWRDILIRYKQTVLGLSWSIIRPFLTMVVLTIIFGKVAKLDSEGVPYPVLVFSATLAWQFFATSFQMGSNSLIMNAAMVSKIYFPRIICPTSAMIVSFIDFIISLIILLGIMIYYKFIPEWTIITLPLFLLFATIPSLGASLWISALNVRYRDFKHIVPFVVQFGLYISPVGFSSNIVPERWRFLYSLNPMVGVIDGFRWAILGRDINIYLPGIYLSIVLSFLLLISGFWYFGKTEKTFADVI